MQKMLNYKVSLEQHVWVAQHLREPINFKINK
jgi:hypothetical protein